MPSKLKLYFDSVTAANNLEEPYHSNVLGTVISAVAWANNGDRECRGRLDSSNARLYYGFEVLSSTSVRVTSATDGGDETVSNDYTVAAGLTYENLVPGVAVTLNLSLTAGHTAKVYVGAMADDDSLYIVRGAPSGERQLIVKNPDLTATARLCKLRIGRHVEFENTAGSPLADFYVKTGTPNPAVDTFAVTISNGTSSGKKYTFTGSGGTYVADNCAINTVYDLESTGLRFLTPGTLPSNSDTATCTVHELADALQLAPDVAGVPGTWVDWDSVDGVLLDLVPAGETQANIVPGGYVSCWMRANPADDHVPGEQYARIWIECGYEVE